MRVRSALKDVEGVTNVVKVDVHRHDVIVSYDERVTSPDKIAEALAQIGYPPEGEPEMLR
ncbi:heavy-metal-associated domain-containing protein [Desulfovermiculus halophilus]|uniref:heavy-metal-associated domain-containing protein n=1 Tax=Desulfovermiculus halophilus TaxID=339722 RepID=UPI000A01BF5A|nr:heavy-metal-associated domain-containing protein [Desulfovermiculus halophilus]